MIESNKSSNHVYPPNVVPSSQLIQPIAMPTRSILPIPYHNHIPRSINHLIEDYLLHNLTNPQTLTLNQGVVSIQYMTNSVYIGQIQSTSEEQQQKAGKGIYKYANNQVYMGDWKNGCFNGLGMYIFQNGDVYQGLFYNGQSMKGVLYYANGDIYEGQFKDGLKHGQGNMKYYDSLTQAYSEYSGKWKKGYKHGIGTYSNRQSQIKGNWEGDKINGQVTIKSFQNIQLNIPYWEYQGIMSGNQLIKGHIKIEYKKGYDQFEGDIYKGKLEGKGKLVQKWQSGQCYSYQAEFKQGKIQQHGIMKKFSADNKFHKKSDNILFFQGFVSQSQQIDGNGKIIYGNQDKYQGLFKAGLRCGQGVYQFRNGDIYVGQFKDDQMQGKGRYLWSQLNLKYSGLFENNKIKQQDHRQKIQQFFANKQLSKNTSNQTSEAQVQAVKKIQRINWTYANSF